MYDHTEVIPLPQCDPLLRDVTVLAIVPDDWAAPPLSRHYILTRLSRYFNVIWHAAPCYWRHSWSQSPGPFSRSRQKVKGGVSPGFKVYYPPPEVFNPYFVKRLLEKLRTRQVKALLREAGPDKTILHIWRPQFNWAIEQYPHDLLCYHVVDEYTFSAEEIAIQPDERALLERADQVIVHSRGLFEKKGRLNPHTVQIPNGVAFEAYRRPRPEPEMLAPIPRPRIGYIGYIKTQLDIDLLFKLAKGHPHWSFVYVGPQKDHEKIKAISERLFALANVYYLGRQGPDSLPAFAQHFDVCTMCYRLNDYTKYTYPLKLHEYLASGTPVIATPINSLLEYADLITLASTEREWSEGIANILAGAEESADRRQRRIDLARAHDWDRIAFRVARVLAERLGDSYLKRFDEATACESQELATGLPQ